MIFLPIAWGLGDDTHAIAARRTSGPFRRRIGGERDAAMGAERPQPPKCTGAGRAPWPGSGTQPDQDEYPYSRCDKCPIPGVSVRVRQKQYGGKQAENEHESKAGDGLMQFARSSSLRLECFSPVFEGIRRVVVAIDRHGG
jgi:hypothetical protein